MAYYEDLSPYEYAGVEPTADVLNVGWLSRDYEFPQGSVSDAFLFRLRRAVGAPVRRFCGFHECEFCDIRWDGSDGDEWPQDRSQADAIGNGEIRVPGEGGITYVAPTLVHHYVVAHGYLPPPGFIAAVESIFVGLP